MEWTVQAQKLDILNFFLEIDLVLIAKDRLVLTHCSVFRKEKLQFFTLLEIWDYIFVSMFLEYVFIFYGKTLIMF